MTRPSTRLAHDLAFACRDEPTARLRDVGIAGACLARRPRRRALAPRRGPAGVTLLENGGRNDGPPDLDELWRDFNRKLSGLFGGSGGAKRGNGGGGDPAAARTSSPT